LNNLGPGAILSAVKILLCIDLLFSYPLVIAASRDIIETGLLFFFFILCFLSSLLFRLFCLCPLFVFFSFPRWTWPPAGM